MGLNPAPAIGTFRTVFLLETVKRPRWVGRERETGMLKFIGGTVGIIFLIGLLVVVGLLALIF
jgi:hypothetical protein